MERSKLKFRTQDIPYNIYKLMLKAKVGIKIIFLEVTRS